MMAMGRREFVARGAAFAAGFAGLQRVYAGAGASAWLRDPAYGYGPLVPDPKGVLDLPSGFAYRALSAFDELMDDGQHVPGLHDGMAAFAGPNGTTVLVRNHELDGSLDKYSGYGKRHERFAKLDRSRVYDAGMGEMPALGGTTTIVYDTKMQRLLKHSLSLAGTLNNCAGGPTPWGSWLTCEETTVKKDDVNAKDHGFVFEVPATDRMGLAMPTPITAMGRFRHEAVAVHPECGCVYQTEDLDDGIIYRYIPKTPGKLLDGGKLQALCVRDQPSLDTRNWLDEKMPRKTMVPQGKPMAVKWIDLDDVLSPKDDLRVRGAAAGAAVFARAEGMWYGRDAVYFACTNGGRLQKGQIWRYMPSAAEGRGSTAEDASPGTLELFVESHDASLLENADNLTVSPWGDLIVCEDEIKPADGKQHLVGVTPAGELYHFARNAKSKAEFAGATFSPDGSTLFVNIQTPGVTLAITGPWKRG
ncbi:MAG: alkaline phosphatase PhoX [Phycisphaerales bacterium]